VLTHQWGDLEPIYVIGLAPRSVKKGSGLQITTQSGWQLKSKL